MDELFQQLGNFFQKEILILDHPINTGQIAILAVTLVISFGVANLLRWRFRQFLKGLLRNLLFPIVIIIGTFLGLLYCHRRFGPPEVPTLI